MSIEKRLLDVAHNAFMEKSYAHEMTAAEERDAIAYTIEAYEAAKWRPMEEAPMTGREILVMLSDDSYFPGKYIVIYDIGGIWSDTTGQDIRSEQLGNIFRTIDPPSQK